MNIGEEGEAIEVPLPVHPDELPAEPEPAAEPVPDAEPVAARDRIAELAALADGWLDGEGLRPAAAALGKAREAIAVLAVRPRLYPTPEGGVQAEWGTGDHEFCVTFEPDGSLHGEAVSAATGSPDDAAGAELGAILRHLTRVPA